MNNIFEVTDESGRKIRLPKERWVHIQAEHPRINDLEEIQQTLINPLKVTTSKYDPENVRYYYRYNKNIGRYLFVAVKHLNGDGFIITVYYMRKIQ